MRPWQRRLGALFASVTCIAAVGACTSIVGIKEVHLKGAKATTDERDGSTEPTPTPPEGDDGSSPVERPNVVKIALGNQHTCLKKASGSVSCWGADDQGQTGGGTLDPSGIVATPRTSPGVADAIDIATGAKHTCVVRKSGKVSCWGLNLGGQLGNGVTGTRSASPVDVIGITNAFAVAAGGNFSCAVRGSGRVACWGENGSGQLGKGDDSPSAVPVEVLGLTDIVAIAAGLSHTCAVRSIGSVVCWGNGDHGQLGREGGSTTPVPVEGLSDVAGITAGATWSCALTKSGSAKCWGANEHGQLGSGSTEPSASPVDVLGLTSAIALSAGQGHTCAALSNGDAMCWGVGGRGQLGDGSFRSDTDIQSSPVVVSGASGIISIGAGGHHSCAASTSTVDCWGGNESGQLGIGTPLDALNAQPVTVP